MAPAVVPAPKKQPNLLSARRGLAHKNLRLPGIVAKDDMAAPLGDQGGMFSSVLRLDAQCTSSLQSNSLTSLSRTSTSPRGTSGSDREVDVQPASLSISDVGYHVHEVLGSGSMAVVYRVTRHNDGQVFAAKRVRHVHRDASIQEHKIMQDLDHKSILQSKALFDFPVELWLCTELCAEGSVSSYVEKHGAFGDGHCRTLARQLVEGVLHLHCRRIVHRDIKPDNLFLAEGASQLKIGDFNSAVKIGQQAAEHGSWMLSMRGTPLYAAPELRFNLDWNERVDIWAVGLSVYYMAQAASPFNVGDWRVVETLQRGELPHIAWRGMSAAAAHFVRQCLVVSMRDRPTAMELLFHPALEVVSGNRSSKDAQHPNLCMSSEDAQPPKSCTSSVDSTVRSSCGLLSGCTSPRTSRSAADGDWRDAALRTLKSERFRISAKQFRSCF